MALDPLRPLEKGSTDTLLRTDRANELLAAVDALKKTRVLVGGDGGSRFDAVPGESVLSITRPDLIRALPSGAGVNVTFSPNPPAGGHDGDIWIQTDPAQPPIFQMYSFPLFFIGQLTLNQIFGYFAPPAGATVSGVQIFMQTPPVGADAVFALVDGTGASLGVSVACPAGQNYASVNVTLAIGAGGIVRAKITQVGASIPGGYATLALTVTG